MFVETHFTQFGFHKLQFASRCFSASERTCAGGGVPLVFPMYVRCVFTFECVYVCMCVA